MTDQGDGKNALDPHQNRLLACITHEMRSPLTSIMGFTEMLVEGMAGDLTDTQREYIQTIEQKSLALLYLVNQVSDMARMRASAYDGGILSVLDVCHQCLTDVYPLADKKNMELHDEVEDFSLPSHIDPHKLRSIITNLLSNAVKYTLEDGKVHLVVRRLESPQGPLLHVDVTDTGIGMTSAEAGRVFEPFYRVRGAHTEGYPGTGLGLYIVQDGVQSLGGSVRVTSERGVGSTFTVELPLTG